ncbi:glycosyltransferase [Actinoplanes sp. HUAS TT8]|uniref:glycosyltransferase n=1 Tax=Actinoplanes sp. HUAS TT8 TaxID=3447453 RepID=UPI003F5242F5
MSTYLMATVPTTTHVSAMVPVARTLTGAGHRVHWYGDREFRATIEAAGATLVPMDKTGDPVVQGHELAGLSNRLIPDALIASTDFTAAARHAERTGEPWISVGLDPLPLSRREMFRPRTAPAVISPLLHLQNGVPALDPPRELPPQVQHVGALTLTGCLHGGILVTDQGFTTVQTALAHGIPVLLTSGDLEVADRLAWTGSGLHLRRATPRRIGRAVGRILGDPSFHEAATSLRDIYHGYDTPAVLLRLIEQTTMALMLQR